MSTWISNLGLILLLGGCVAGEIGLSGSSRATPILGGQVNLGVPRGYCMDPVASQVAEDSAVMIIGRCSDAGDEVPAAITATVGEAGSAAVLAAGVPALAAYFASDEGRAALSREGVAEAVVVQEIRSSDGVLSLHLTDRALGDYWRAVMAARGRLVTLAVTAPEGQPLSSDQGKALLDNAVKAMQSANTAGG